MKRRAMTPLEKRVRDKYILIANDGGTAHKTLIKVDHQYFCVIANRTKTGAQWYGRQIAIALARMIETETKETK